MLSRAVSTPAFGQANLSNCEREQIHLAGSIQPHGCLLVIREADGIIVQASANAASFLGLSGNIASGDIVGRGIDVLEGDLAQQLRPHLSDPLHEIARGVRCHVGNPLAPFDGLVHRPAAGGLIVELERAGPSVDLSQHLERGLQRIIAAGSLRALCDETTRIFKALTGYDRVMVYRFDDQGHGEILSEEREPAMEAYLGNRYPSSDIPQIARRLYERNRVRVLADVEFAPVPLVPPLSPVTGAELDMSLCFLRSSSPIHVQYLKNMGVRATLVVSLMVNGKLWGLVSCHHRVPRFVHFEVRAVCDLLAEAVATRIAALESFAQAQAELSVRRLEQRMIRAISREGDWRGALFDGSNILLEPVQATGAVLLYEGEVRTIGDVPDTVALRKLGAWLDRQAGNGVISTASLGTDAPEFELLTAIASGLLATPVSTAPGEYLIWLRPERVRTVTWGGNPFKPTLIGDDPATLSPRRSFAQWHQLVEGTSDPWSEADIAFARLVGETVSDVIIQFRSVRMLLAEDQLNQVRRQVEQSAQPVMIADADGRILKTNAAFDALLPDLPGRPAEVADLLPLFNDPREVGRRLDDLVTHRHAWRGEVVLAGRNSVQTPLLVRGDPVFTSLDRILGFVLLFTDLTERKAAEAARRSFQEGVMEQRPSVPAQFDSSTDLQFRSILSTIGENAQLAALEIADRVDPAHMPRMLEALRASVARTAEVLRSLLWHVPRQGRTPPMSGRDVSDPHDGPDDN
ncbi:GAF domain-containing protein [Rhodopila globiformis]|uniref:Histidine kinase n=1 Tax=Rhodopila globiformis TaxID=1071 RepID=A0A2S6NJ60_RHOGL|nr:GAF domain-containing protein [Rhodopila globiformis]PPQ34707.1 histidine kinase [Rhodopila globiformis]